MTENLENLVNNIKDDTNPSISDTFSKKYNEFQEKYTQNIQKEKNFIRNGFWIIIISLILEIFSLFPVITRPVPEFERFLIDKKLIELLLFILIDLLIIYQMTIFNRWHKQSKETKNSIIRLTFKINADSKKVIITSIIVLISNLFLIFTFFHEIWRPPIPNMRPPPFEIMHYASSINILVFCILEAMLLVKWGKKWKKFNRMVLMIEKELDNN